MMQFAEFVLEFSLKQGQDFIFKKSRIQGISNIPETLKINLTHEQGRKIGNIQGGARQLELSKITLYNNSGRYEVATIFLLCWVGPPLLHI